MHEAVRSQRHRRQPDQVHRARHHRLQRHSRRRRSRPARRILPLVRPSRRRRSRRDHPRRARLPRRHWIRGNRLVRRRLFLRMGLVEAAALATPQPRTAARSSSPRSSTATWSPRRSAASPTPTRSRAASAPWATSGCGTRSGADSRPRNSSPPSTRSSPACATRSPAATTPPTRSPATCRQSGPNALGLAAGIPIPVGAFDAHWDAHRRQHPPRRRRQRHRHVHLHHRPQRPADPRARRLRRSPRLGRSRRRSASRPACPPSATSSPPSPGAPATTVAALSEEGAHLKAGQTGLLRLTWDNGDRTVLVNPALGGVTFGWNLHHTAADELHAAVEGSALHTRVIFNRMEENGAPINRVINGGGIPKKNAKLNQIYANVLRKPVLVPEGDVTSLGSVIIAFLAAGDFKSIEEAQDALCPPLQHLHARTHRGRPLRSPFPALPRCLFRAGHAGRTTRIARPHPAGTPGHPPRRYRRGAKSTALKIRTKAETGRTTASHPTAGTRASGSRCH